MKPFDLQVNGYRGIDFNASCTTEEIARACQFLDDDGVGGILATVITDDLEVMALRLAAIAQAYEENPQVKKIIRGIHIEGPFINPEKGYVGAHPKQHVRPADLEGMKVLMGASRGLAKLVTLAPEYDSDHAVTRWLTGQGVVVSAGHCNPTMDQLRSAIDAGLSMFTHLGNGCPMTMHRHDNIIQRVLSLSEDLWCCFIPDGVHIEFFALKNYIQCVGIDRCILVTDAISAAGLVPGRYSLGNWDLKIGEDLVARSPGGDHFVGSTVTMPRAFENLSKLGFSKEEFTRMASTNPLQALGLTV